MKIAIDFISTCKIVDGIAKYTGGTNYSKQRILFLKEHCLMSGHNILLLVQNEFKVSEKEEKKLFENIEFVYANDLTQVDYSKFDIVTEYNVKNQRYPLVLSVPHSGRILPAEFLANVEEGIICFILIQQSAYKEGI